MNEDIQTENMNSITLRQGTEESASELWNHYKSPQDDLYLNHNIPPDVNIDSEDFYSSLSIDI